MKSQNVSLNVITVRLTELQTLYDNMKVMLIDIFENFLNVDFMVNVSLLQSVSRFKLRVRFFHLVIVCNFMF